MNETEQNPGSGFGVTEIIITAILLGVVVAIVTPNFIRTRSTSCANACINNLRQIDAAVNEWALEKHETNGSSVSMNDIKPYIKLNSAGSIPSCPKGGKYTLRKVGDDPQVTCSLSTLTPGDFLP